MIKVVIADIYSKKVLDINTEAAGVYLPDAFAHRSFTWFISLDTGMA